MDIYYKDQYLKNRTKIFELETEVMGLKQKIRDLERNKKMDDINPKNEEGSRKEKFLIKHLKDQNKQKDIIIKNLNDSINNLEVDVKKYKDNLKNTTTLLQECTNREFISEDKMKNLKRKIEDLLEDKDNQKIQIEKLKKYAKERMEELKKMEKDMKKEEKSQKKEEEKKQKEYERKRKQEEARAKKEEEKRKRKFEEEQKKKEEERIRKEKEAARKAAEEEKRRKEKEAEDLKRKQEEAVKEFQRKKEEEQKKQFEKRDLKEKIENDIRQKWGKIDLPTLNVYYNLGELIINMDLKKLRKMMLKYHPDKAIKKPLEEQIKYEIIFNALNQYKKKLGGKKK